MRFGAWVRLQEAAGVAPAQAGVLQVRLEVGLVQYPRGKSAMCRYEGAEDLREACLRLAAAHPGGAWLVRWSRDPVVDLGGAAARIIAEFVERFGEAPRMATGEGPGAPRDFRL